MQIYTRYKITKYFVYNSFAQNFCITLVLKT